MLSGRSSRISTNSSACIFFTSLPGIGEKLEARLNAGVAGALLLEAGGWRTLSVTEVVVVDDEPGLNSGMWEIADQSGGAELLGRLPLPGIETARAL